jgi:hypothetical protein
MPHLFHILLLQEPLSVQLKALASFDRRREFYYGLEQRSGEFCKLSPLIRAEVSIGGRGKGLLAGRVSLEQTQFLGH